MDKTEVLAETEIIIEKEKINVSVRAVVELILRCGDINPILTLDNAMDLGIKAHKAHQKNRVGDYKKEVALSCQFDLDGFDFSLCMNGRADGIYTDTDGMVCIEEIKGTLTPFELIDGNNPVHWGQAACYAYIYSKQNDLREIKMNITYLQLETEEQKIYYRSMTTSELEDFMIDLMNKYALWVKMELDWRVERNASIETLTFPYEKYRKGQREMSVYVYNTIKAGKKIYVNAPTGIGKTISTIFPSLKAMNTMNLNKIFYLTAKTITRTVAEDAFYRMKKNGLRFKNLTLTAKYRICFMEKMICNPEYCPYAKGHYDRINEAMFALLNENDNMTRETIMEYAEKYKVCPYEFTLDLSIYADAVICDYNYVFDPFIYLKRFFRYANRNDYIFLVDEAHNLVDRAREMYSAQLSKSAFDKLKKLIPKPYPALKNAVKAIIAYFKDQKELCENVNMDNTKFYGYFVRREIDDTFLFIIDDFMEHMSLYLKERSDRVKAGEETQEDIEIILDAYFAAINYRMIAEFYDDHYVTYVNCESRDVTIKLFCLDPGNMVGESLKRGTAAVIFSATLTPIEYYREVLGGEEDDVSMNLPSPFDKKNLCLLVNGGISTKYADREASYESIAGLLYAITAKKTGNYMIFFSSYEYMTAVYDLFVDMYPGIAAVSQKNNLSEAERDEFLALFEENPKKVFIGFCVLGGIFSEGIDLAGNRLIGTIIVGVGLPRLSANQDIIREYFDRKNGMGYKYAYIYPGMNKVLQASGRVIRTEEDRGTVCLVDTRYNTREYRMLFPDHWSAFKPVKNTTQAEKILEEFWDADENAGTGKC